MAPSKADDFLGLSDSENEDIGGYNSDAEIQKGGRASNRKALSDDGDNSDSEDEQKIPNKSQTSKQKSDDIQENDDEVDENASDDAQSTKKSRRTKIPELELPDVNRPLTKKNMIASAEAIKKSGVVYMSRIPPFMKPTKLRSLLEPYGKINRIFLAPEDPTAHARRVKAGGNKKKSYTEGWVEFVKKKDAKAACELLNAQTIGGKKGSYYRDDLWNLLYLHGFKWHNLTEQIAAENAERSSRMRAEISKTAKENKEFVRNVERAKMLDGIQAKAQTKKRKADGEETTTPAPADDRGNRTFKQIPLAKKAKATDEPSAQVSRVLSKIF